MANENRRQYLMKTIHRNKLAHGSLALFLILLLGLSTSYGGTETSGGSKSGKRVYGEYWVKQDEYVQGARELHFTTYNSKKDINGWKASITVFNNSSSWREGARDIKVKAYNPPTPPGFIEYNSKVKVAVTHWLNAKKQKNCRSSLGMAHVYWKPTIKLQDSLFAMPDHYWHFDTAYTTRGRRGPFYHPFVITNDGSEAVTLAKLEFLPEMHYYPVLSEIEFPGPADPDVLLNPGEVYYDTIVTADSLMGGYIYLKYILLDETGTDTVCEAWGCDPIVSPPVPTLTFYGLLTLLGLLLISAIIVIRYRRRATLQR
jgi:hypothetical protein